jgi:hypothetical protein
MIQHSFVFFNSNLSKLFKLRNYYSSFCRPDLASSVDITNFDQIAQHFTEYHLPELLEPYASAQFDGIKYPPFNLLTDIIAEAILDVYDVDEDDIQDILDAIDVIYQQRYS